MNKLFTLFAASVISLTASAQNDTLLYENFDVDNSASYLLIPNGNDTNWVSFDYDLLTDANSRPANWYWSQGAFGIDDSTGCMFSSSWFAPAGQAINYLMTPPVQIIDANASLSWRAAPRQTPLYLDGYKIIVSTTDNIETSFTDTIYVAAEYVSGSGPNFAAYTFSPGFVHGLDGTYIEYDADSSRWIGVLRPFSVSLAQYSGQSIYIAFLHDALDDNLIAVDDILVTGTLPVGITEPNDKISLEVKPNPVADKLEVSFYLPVTSQVLTKIYDIHGKLVKESSSRMMLPGNQQLFLNVADLAAGNYTLDIITGKKGARTKFVVSK